MHFRDPISFHMEINVNLLHILIQNFLLDVLYVSVSVTLFYLVLCVELLLLIIFNIYLSFIYLIYLCFIMDLQNLIQND